MILDLTSFGWSGCGAYHDLIREYDNIEFPYKGDWEFHLLWTVDGIYDLEHKLCHKSCRVYDSDFAIRRFLDIAKHLNTSSMIGYNRIYKNPSFYDISKKYIDKIVKIKFPGHSFDDITHPNKWEDISSVYNNIINRLLCNRIARKIGLNRIGENIQFYNAHTMMVAYHPDDFLQVTQDYLRELISYMRKDNNKVLITDQMFPPDCPELFYKYITEKHKTIIVRRDPRDTYITMKRGTKFPFPVPHTIDEFIWFYKHIVENTKLPNTEYRLSLNFEDIIYKYDETIERIQNFINLGNHTNPKTRFIPEVSINNTQLVNLYPEYSDDIAKIEAALPDSLYPFEKYPFKRTSNTIF